MDSTNKIEDNYIRIISTGYFSEKKFNSCIIDLKQSKVFNVTYDNDGNRVYNFYKDLTEEQMNKLFSYINDNDLLNVNINNLVMDASDNIEICIGGKTNLIRNSSNAFTHGESHIFDDIVDIVFDTEKNGPNKPDSFFGLDLTGNVDNSSNGLNTVDISALNNNYNNNDATIEIQNIDAFNDDIVEEKEKAIESVFADVLHYSIMNKSLEELLAAKKKFINDWEFVLNNSMTEAWIMRTATYRVHINSIIDAILRRVEDNISIQQSALIKSISENKYIENLNIDSIIEVVQKLNSLERK